MEHRYKKIFEGTIADYMKALKEQENKSSKPRKLPEKKDAFGKAFATAKRTGSKSFSWKNPITKKTRIYKTENEANGKKIQPNSRKI